MGRGCARCTLSRTHTRTHAHARTHTHARTRTPAHARTHTHARTRTPAHARTHTHARTRTHERTEEQSNTHAHVRMHTCVGLRSAVRDGVEARRVCRADRLDPDSPRPLVPRMTIYIHTHTSQRAAHAHTHTHARARTHTHARTRTTHTRTGWRAAQIPIRPSAEATERFRFHLPPSLPPTPRSLRPRPPSLREALCLARENTLLWAYSDNGGMTHWADVFPASASSNW
jgi:hypothetical protein